MNSLVSSILDKIRLNDVKWLEFQFVDVLGSLQHINIPTASISEEDFVEGFGKLDGSSIRGFKEIHESDMIMRPDLKTFAMLPWYQDGQKTARVIVDVYEGFTKDRFSRDSRFIAQRAEEEANKMGFDKTYWGPELEFFVFDSVQLLPNPVAARDSWGGSGYSIESLEAPWHNNGGKGYPINFKAGYYPSSPQDTLTEFRNEVCRVLLENFGIMLDAHHHEVATAGQCEINMKYDELVAMADKVVTYKYVIKMLANKWGKIATFMPKPIFGDNASGMHTHQSLWTNGKNAFFNPDDSYAELSQLARYYIGGLLEHSRALCAITNPTTNSYRRLVPGYEAPVFIAWSVRNRSANVRIPMYHKGIEHAKRLEFRTPDPSCNPYIAFAAMLMAGLDGIRKKIDPGNPVDEDIYKITPERRKALGVRELPGSLKEAIEELQSDSTFLKPVFGNDFIEKYIDFKKDEHLQVSLRPTPWEFFTYLNV